MTGIDMHGDHVRASGVTVKLSNTGKVLFPTRPAPQGVPTQCAPKPARIAEGTQ